MTITLLNPNGLPALDVYHQVAITSGTRTVYIAGQVAWDAPADLATQVEQAYVSVGTALAGAGGAFTDVAKLTVYVVDWTPDKMPALLEGVTRGATRLGVDHRPPVTLIGVAALDVPEHLVEIEAVAVLD
ncbi:RidA family protein [Streptomyces sp. NPDC004539]|uniref:RidA family protein n=1 Tax=Streptomyces sp. NPDC004539 TaxID=3154280 RepID=UPI0033A91B95